MLVAMLGHVGLALALQALIDRLTGSRVAGACAAIGSLPLATCAAQPRVRWTPLARPLRGSTGAIDSRAATAS